MDTRTLLQHGHDGLQTAIANIPSRFWYVPGVSGTWSVKDIIAHLNSFEQVLIDVLNATLANSPTGTLNRMLADHQQFNTDEVSRRKKASVRGVLAEFGALHEEALALLDRIPPAVREQKGHLPWYGAEFSLDDFITLTIYGNIHQHTMEIVTFGQRVLEETVPVQFI